MRRRRALRRRKAMRKRRMLGAEEGKGCATRRAGVEGAIQSTGTDWTGLDWAGDWAMRPSLESNERPVSGSARGHGGLTRVAINCNSPLNAHCIPPRQTTNHKIREKKYRWSRAGKKKALIGQ